MAIQNKYAYEYRYDGRGHVVKCREEVTSRL